MTLGYNIIYSKISKILLFIILISSCKKQELHQVRVYNDASDSYLKLELDEIILDSCYELTYYSDNVFQFKYLINLKDSISYKFFKTDTLLLIKSANKIFKANTSEYDIYNYSCEIPNYNSIVRYFWCEQFGVFYTFECSDLRFSKIVQFDDLNNIIFDDLIKQLHDDINFFYNVSMPDSLINELKKAMKK